MTTIKARELDRRASEARSGGNGNGDGNGNGMNLTERRQQHNSDTFPARLLGGRGKRMRAGLTELWPDSDHDHHHNNHHQLNSHTEMPGHGRPSNASGHGAQAAGPMPSNVLQQSTSSQQGAASSSKGHLAHYQLGDCLGRGAFGQVYRALNWTSGETVAVKQIQLSNIPKSELGEIMSEIDLLKNLNHANIVKYKGFVKTRDYLYIILEYCENGSLQNICKRFGKFPESLVAVYISQVLEGLLYLHDQGVIHRDIKGANILTTKDGAVKLADFGVATRTGAMSDYAVVGSPYWMAPEVIDQSGATTASDIWSVGCVVIELLEGKPPYHFLDPMPALFRIVQDDCPPLPEGASPVVKDFLLHCFQKDANLRVSARKLLRHPWMTAARRQLDQMKSGGSFRPRTVYDEAVKSVQEWNEALKDPPRPPAPRGTDSGTLKPPAQPVTRRTSGSISETLPSQRTPTRKTRVASRPQPLSEELTPRSNSNAEKIDTSVAIAQVAREGPDSPTLAAPLGRTGPATSLINQRRNLVDLQQPEEQTDNWDDDFEEDITMTKIAALEKSGLEETEGERQELAEPDDNTDTIRPLKSPNLSSPSRPPRAKQMPPAGSVEVEDYSDLVSDEEESHLDERIRNLRQQNSIGRRLFHPNDLKTLAAPKANGSNSPPAHATVTNLTARPMFSNQREPRPLSPISPPGSRSNSLKIGDDKWKETRQTLGKYSEANEEDYSDVFGKVTSDANDPTEGQTLQLNTRLSNRSWLGDGESDQDDPFAEIDEDFEEEADLEANVARDKHARMCALIVELVEDLQPRTSQDELIETCEQLIGILTDMPEMKAQLLSSHGALAVIQLLEATKTREVISALLGILNLIIADDQEAQENLCLIGAIPVVMAFTSKKFPHEVRLEAAHFVYAMCSTSSLTLQFVLSCRGLKTLVELLDEDYNEQKDLVWLGVNCVCSVLELQSPASRNDFCRMLAQEGLLDPLSTALLSVIKDSDDLAESAKARILQIFLLYSQSDAWLKKAVATRGILRRLLKACTMLEPASLTAMLKVIKNLSMSPAILDLLQNCNTIETLTHILGENYDGPYGTEMSNQVLNAMYNLCRLNKSRQEEAAQAGIIPQLLRVARTSSPLKQFALPILCDFAHAGKATRKMFWQHNGLAFYLKLLEDPYWQVSALESVLVWLQDETARVEDVLLKGSSIESLLCVFTTAKANSFENLLEPFIKICRISTGVTMAVAKNPSFFRRLIDRLGHGKAVVRLNLLRITRMVCDVHPDRQGLIERYGLFEIIEKLSQQDGAVLVRELAKEILAQRYMQPQQRKVRRTASETNVGGSGVGSTSSGSTPPRVSPLPGVAGLAAARKWLPNRPALGATPSMGMLGSSAGAGAGGEGGASIGPAGSQAFRRPSLRPQQRSEILGPRVPK